jgi:hypothetical protein
MELVYKKYQRCPRWCKALFQQEVEGVKLFACNAGIPVRQKEKMNTDKKEMAWPEPVKSCYRPRTDEEYEFVKNRLT